MKRLGIAVALCTLAVVATQAQADIATYTFFNITNNGNPDVGTQLQMQVLSDSEAGFLGDPGQVQFNFTVLPGPEFATIAAVYFDDGILETLTGLVNGAGVSFTEDAVDPVSPPDLPGGQSIFPVFDVTDNFAADSDAGQGGIANGIDPGELLSILFDVDDGFDGVIANLGSGDLRVGLHVQRIGEFSGSDSYVNVPLPGAVLLGMLGLAAAGRKLRKMC